MSIEHSIVRRNAPGRRSLIHPPETHQGCPTHQARTNGSSPPMKGASLLSASSCSAPPAPPSRDLQMIALIAPARDTSAIRVVESRTCRLRLLLLRGRISCISCGFCFEGAHNVGETTHHNESEECVSKILQHLSLLTVLLVKIRSAISPHGGAAHDAFCALRQFALPKRFSVPSMIGRKKWGPLQSYSDAQLNQGLRFLASNSCSDHVPRQDEVQQDSSRPTSLRIRVR